jgi:phytoene desaturase
MRSKAIIVVGAGIGGLASAIRLAARGHKVQVFESNAYPGGKLHEFTIDGFRFDAGPSLFTQPHYLERLFQLAGKPIANYFEYQRIPVICHYFWEDGTRLKAHADNDQFAKEVEQQLGVPAKHTHKVLKDAARKYALGGTTFLEYPLHHWKTWLRWSVLKALLQLPVLDVFTTMNAVNERLARHPKLVQLFNRYATYNGSNPYKAPGILTIIPHFEYNIGAFTPKGGMHSITKALFALAKDLGVQFHFGQNVTQILTSKDAVQGIVVNGKTVSSDEVVCNMDIWLAYRKLLSQLPPPERILKQQRSTSALIFYWGIQASFPELDLHNIFFSEDYKKEFELLEAGQVTDDPTVYINITSKYEPEDAPAGCENWFVMVNVPPNQGQDWEHWIPGLRSRIIQKLSRILGQDVGALIACEEVLDPRSIESRTSSHQGALYGSSSNNRFAAFLRHANEHSKVKGLYFTGGSVHPGGGIPLCLLSAQIVDELQQHA